MQRILPPTLFAALAAAMIVLAIFVPGPDLGWPVRSAGGAALAGGLVLNVRHARLFDQLGTNIKTFDDPGQLVVTGAFAWSRNPMYLGFLLMLVGLATMLVSPAALAGPVIFFVAADRWYIPFEEQRMATIFSADYEQYQHTVHRWIGWSNQ